MIDALNLAGALLAGAVLGALFFSGLWWTVRKGVTSKHPALLFFVSMLLRMSMALTGFYFILGDSWQRLLAGLLGFVVARLIVIRLTRVPDQTDGLMRGAGHAP